VTELDLTRNSGDRHQYLLAGVGTLRLESSLSSVATAEAATGTWRLSRRGFWQRQMEATTPAGEVSGTFAPRGLRRGGALRWGDRELTLQPIGTLRERYLLAESGHELARIDGRSWGRGPVTVTVAEPAAIEPGLLLFACFVAHQLADDSASGSTTVMAAG
jgi:hypothetical protein